MNQFDAAASPMFDCFTSQADFRPFMPVANRIPLDELNPRPEDIQNQLLKKNALVSARLNFKIIDACPENCPELKLSGIQSKGLKVPYPDWAVTLEQADDD